MDFDDAAGVLRSGFCFVPLGDDTDPRRRLDLYIYMLNTPPDFLAGPRWMLYMNEGNAGGELGLGFEENSIVVTPTPEPSSLLLFGPGVAVVLAAARRKRRLTAVCRR